MERDRQAENDKPLDTPLSKWRRFVSRGRIDQQFLPGIANEFKRRGRHYLAGALALIVLAVVISKLTVPARGVLEEYKETRYYFGTHVKIQCLYDKKAYPIERVISKCWQKMDEIQVTMNSHSTVGYVAQVNESGYTAGVQVSDDFYRIVGDAIEYTRKTRGTFDITVMPLLRLWKKAEEEGAPPVKKEIEIALENVGATKFIKLEGGNRVRLTKAGVQIDLGAIAPPFAVDAVAKILTDNKIQHFMLDGGGEIVCRGNQPGQNGWRIGVQDPVRKSGESIMDILRLEDCAVSTSGNYERFYTIQGRRYSHVIDPRTGQPAQNVISATVIAPTAEEANAFSTALCVLGGKNGIAWIHSIPDVQAMILETKNGKIVRYATRGYRAYQIRR